MGLRYFLMMFVVIVGVLIFISMANNGLFGDKALPQILTGQQYHNNNNNKVEYDEVQAPIVETVSPMGKKELESSTINLKNGL